MTLLERLKEVTEGSAFHNAILEDLSYREFDTLVDYLPLLLELAEAAKRYVDDDSQESARLYADVVAALAKLEVEA